MTDVPPIYYINLKRCHERNAQMISQFEKYKVNRYNRIDAIDGKNNKLYNKYYQLIYKPDSTKVELAVTLSHIKAIRKAHRDNCVDAIIMEDDIDISILFEFIDLFKKTIGCLPSNADTIQLHMISFYPGKLQDNLLMKWNISKNMWGAGMYYIKRSGMEKIMGLIGSDNLINFRNYVSVADYLIYSVTNSYTSTYPFGIPFCRDSTIHPEHIENTHRSRISTAWKLVENTRNSEKKGPFALILDGSTYKIIPDIINNKNIPICNVIVVVLHLNPECFITENNTDLLNFDLKCFKTTYNYNKEFGSLIKNKNFCFVVHDHTYYHKSINNLNDITVNKKSSNGRKLCYLKPEYIDLIITYHDKIKINTNLEKYLKDI